MLCHEIIEGRDSPLYHATRLFPASKILADDRIIAETEHVVQGKPIKGVSLTRSRTFAFQFRQYHDTVVFAFDQAKLGRRFQLIPVNYFRGSQRRTLGAQRSEAEEFLVGDLTPVSAYLVAIYLDSQVAQRLATHPYYARLVTHPLAQPSR